MPYPCSKKCRRISCLLYMPVLFISMNSLAQAKWIGEAGDGQWTTAANWAGNQLPAPADDVILDNSAVTGNYMVYLPGSAAVTVRSIAISPVAGNTIQLILPQANTVIPAFTASGPGYGITINSGGLLVNSSGASGGAAIAVADSIRINNGGQYTHNSRSSHAALVTVLSASAGTEKGIFKFDVPGGGYTFAVTNRTYGTLLLNGDASGGSQIYTTSAASPLTINGDFIIQAGVTVNLDVSAAIFIKGNYRQDGGVFNLASQANNNIVYIAGDLLQTAGSITETSNGLPGIELNGNGLQNIQVMGSITSNVSFSVNNNAGVRLLADLSLPYQLQLLNGIVNTNSFGLTLLAGCSIQADSTTSTSFINGPLRKEGLSATSNFVFPVGKGNIQRWVALKETTGNYTVEYFKSNPGSFSAVTATGIQHISSVEYWAITADAAPAPAAAVELSFDNVNSGGVTDIGTLKVAQLLSGVWTDNGNAATTGNAGAAGSVISNPLNIFGPTGKYFTLASSTAAQNPLPLKLVSFKGQLYNNTIVLSWTIEPSWKPASFELQSSADGVHFSLVSTIDTVFNQQAYQYTDRRELTGHQYYRLKPVEKDGSFFYSNSTQVTLPETNYRAIQLRPSVVSTSTRLFINAIAGIQVQVNIYNASGICVETKNILLQAGNNNILLPLQQLPAGLYLLTVNNGNSKINSSRFIKVE